VFCSEYETVRKMELRSTASALDCSNLKVVFHMHNDVNGALSDFLVGLRHLPTVSPIL
jgi:hypothetical protein